MSIITSTSLINQQTWRYAVKKFDATKKIPNDTWKALEESLQLTPSSYGLQPWKFLVITSNDLKKSLTPFTWKQTQVEDCSHYVVFAVTKKMTEAHVTKFIEKTAQVRGTDTTGLEGYKKMMIGDVVNGPRGQVSFEWAARQAYIALGNFMTSAALLGIDTCPIEGFMPEKYDEVLKLPEQNFGSVVCCAAGYRSPEDKYAEAKKVRFDQSDIIAHL